MARGKSGQPPDQLRTFFRMSPMKSFNALMLSLGLIALPAAIALGQEGEGLLEEITVTAQKRQESVQDLPISVTAFSGDAMKALGFTNSIQLAAQTPGLQTAQIFGEGNIPIVSIRGVGLIDFSEHNESPSAVYVDEFYKANLSGLDFQLFDLERAEVLRGPQGTLFGRNATGGLVHYITAKPSQDADGYADVTVGEYGKLIAEGAIGGGLSDTVAGRLSLIYSKQDGYNENDFPGRKPGNALDMWGVRGQLAFDPNDDLSILASFQAGHNKNDGGSQYHHLATAFDPATGLAIAQPDPPFVSADKRRTNTDIQPRLETDFLSGLLRVEYALNDDLELVSLTGFESIEKTFNQDVDAAPLEIFATYYEPEGDEFTQELRLAGDYETSRWVAGVYYMDYQNKGRQYADIGPFFTGAPVYLLYQTVNWDMHTKAWALFGQFEYDFTERLTGVIGVRYGSEDKNFEQSIVSGFGDPSTELEFTKANYGDLTNFDKSNTSYNARLNFQVNDDLLTYAGTSRAYKAGTFNMGFFPLADVNDIPVDQEELTSYEVGFKSEFADGLARLNGAVFYYQYDDYQAFLFDSISLSNFLFNNDATVRGAELELQSSPGNWDLLLGLSFLDTAVLDVQDPLPGGAIRDRDMVMSPKLSANAMVRYNFDAFGGTAALQVDGTYNDSQYLETFNSPAFKEGSYVMGNVRASWTSEDGHWTTAVFVENLTDKEYRAYAFDLTGLLGLSQEVWSRPRWAGITVGYRL
jgi:iron complex outermembrane receptor protein